VAGGDGRSTPVIAATPGPVAVPASRLECWCDGVHTTAVTRWVECRMTFAPISRPGWLPPDVELGLSRAVRER